MDNISIVELANQLIKHSNKDINFVLDERKNRSIASYHLAKNCIYLQKNASLKHYDSLLENGYHFKDFRQFIQMVLSHEIGHALDPELSFLSKKECSLIDRFSSCRSAYEVDELIIEIGEIVLKIEGNAWDYSHPLLPSDLDGDLLNRYKMLCFKSYINGLESWREKMNVNFA